MTARISCSCGFLFKSYFIFYKKWEIVTILKCHKIFDHVHGHPFYIVFKILKVLLIICKMQPLDLLYVRYYTSIYHFFTNFKSFIQHYLGKSFCWCSLMKAQSQADNKFCLIFWKEPTVKRCLLILGLKPLRS